MTKYRRGGMTEEQLWKPIGCGNDRLELLRAESHRVRAPVESWSPRWCECVGRRAHTYMDDVSVDVGVDVCVSVCLCVRAGGRREAGARVKKADTTGNNPFQDYRSGTGRKERERRETGAGQLA